MEEVSAIAEPIAVDKVGIVGSKLKMRARTALIPVDLGLPQDFFGSTPAGLRRQLVAACVFGGGGAVGEWVSAEALRKGQEVWPEALRERPARHLTVMSVLLEVERLGACVVVEQTESGAVVRVGEERVA